MLGFKMPLKYNSIVTVTEATVTSAKCDTRKTCTQHQAKKDWPTSKTRGCSHSASLHLGKLGMQLLDCSSGQDGFF